MTNSGQIELMAPVSNFESLQAAIDNGADSVFWSRSAQHAREQYQFHP